MYTTYLTKKKWLEFINIARYTYILKIDGWNISPISYSSTYPERYYGDNSIDPIDMWELIGLFDQTPHFEYNKKRLQFEIKFKRKEIKQILEDLFQLKILN